MKIRPDQLEAQLKRQLMPVYIISGDEPLQVSECADMIRSYARNQGYSERTIYHIDNSFDWRELLETANSLSLFSDKKIIELRMPNGKPGETGRKVLMEYIKAPSPDNLLLIITDRLDGQIQKSKWFKAVDQAGIFIPSWPVEPDKLPGWIARRLRASGFEATPEALVLLAERVEGNLLAASQEIEKLKLLSNNNRIDEITVRDAVSDSARYDVFHLADAALDGNVKNCVRILNTLRGEGIEAPVVLWALAREIRLLSYLSRQISKGLNQETAFTQSAKTIGFSPYLLKRRKHLINKAIARHSEKDFRSMLIMAGEIDREVKGLGTNNPWNSLLSLTLTLAGAQMLAS